MSEPVVPPVPPLPPYTAPAPAPSPGYAGPPPGYSSGPYAPPYVLPGAQAPVAQTPAPADRSPAPGIVALVAALVAAVVAPGVVAVAAFNVGLGAAGGADQAMTQTGFDLSFLSPVREWVLLGEISFWAGTALGVWALAQGIVAIVRRSGRPQAIAAVAVAAVGPAVFGLALQIALTAGFAAGV